MALGFDAVGP